MERQPCVYLLARASHSTFYTGVTSDLVGRVWQHRTEATKGFTARYGIKRLVWFELHETMESAIRREKQLKRWRRQWKYDLVNTANPTWRSRRGFWVRTVAAGETGGPRLKAGVTAGSYPSATSSSSRSAACRAHSSA